MTLVSVRERLYGDKPVETEVSIPAPSGDLDDFEAKLEAHRKNFNAVKSRVDANHKYMDLAPAADALVDRYCIENGVTNPVYIQYLREQTHLQIRLQLGC